MKSPADYARDIADQFHDKPHLFEVEIDCDGDVCGADISRDGVDLIEKTIKEAIAADRRMRAD